jgi:hypothetical protein
MMMNIHRALLLVAVIAAASSLRAQCDPGPPPVTGRFDVVSGAAIDPATGLLTTGVGVPVTFQALQTGASTEFTWTFEGVDSHERFQAVHAFTSIGDSPVRLSVTIPICDGVVATDTSMRFLRVRPAAPSNDAIVFVGVGVSGTWDTEIVLANPDPFSNALAVGIDNLRPDYACPPLVGCLGDTFVFLPPSGTASLLASTISGFSSGLLPLKLYVSSDMDLPSVRARVVNGSLPSQAIEVPGIRLSTLTALNPVALSFPGATRSSVGHSNIVMAEIANTGSLSILIEAFDSDGALKGSQPFEISSGQTVFLQDVLGQLGVTDLVDGQLRVTKISGDGLMWGTMSTLYLDGGVAVSTGANP